MLRKPPHGGAVHHCDLSPRMDERALRLCVCVCVCVEHCKHSFVSSAKIKLISNQSLLLK